jgi:BirA family biotin operon repressor/biotin-[acetyl-CoA-carboxylase] ligase
MSGDLSLFAERVRTALAEVDAGPFGAHSHYLPSVTSTNDIARELAAEGAPEGTVVVADWQSAGRGRVGRVWEAPPSAALLVSILFLPALPPRLNGRLTMVCGLAAAEAVEEITGTVVSCKWPNDLLLNDKKFAGILVETAFQGSEIAWLIAGLGINVNFRFSENDPLSQTATTLFEVTGRAFDRASLLAAILARVNHWYRHVSSRDLLLAWSNRCSTLGERVHLEAPGGSVEGIAEMVDESGALWVRLDNGERRLVTTAP